MGNYLAFDLGASSGRAILGRLCEGRITIEEVHRFENRGTELNGSYYWNLLGLYNELKTGLRRALELEPELQGMAVDTWGVDFALTDTQGRFLGNPFCYRDPRTDDIFDYAFSKMPQDEIYALTGTQFMSINTVFQLAAMERDNSPVLPIADKLLFIPNAFIYMFCGDVSAEYTIATTSQLYNPVTGDWAWDIIDRFGLPRKIFPPIRKSCTVAGQLRPGICEELKCKPVPVLRVGSHDTASAVAAVPASGDAGGWAFLSSGTWSLLGVELDEPCINAAARESNFTNEGCVDGRIRFLKNIMGLWLVQESRQTWINEGRKYSFAELEEMAIAAEPFRSFVNPNDQRFLAPGDMPARIRDFCRETGQPVPETPGQIVRCATESLALTYRLALEQAEKVTGRKISLLHLVGGGSQDRMLNGFTAGALNRPVIAGPVEATALGNLLGQALATGEISSVAALRRTVADSFDMETFSPENVKDWDQAYKRYRNIL